MAYIPAIGFYAAQLAAKEYMSAEKYMEYIDRQELVKMQLAGYAPAPKPAKPTIEGETKKIEEVTRSLVEEVKKIV